MIPCKALLLDLLLLLAHSSVPGNLEGLRLLLGLAAYLVLPGLVIAKRLRTALGVNEVTTLSLLLGFSYQLLLVTLFWALRLEPVNLFVLQPVGTFAFVLLLC